MKTIQQDLKSLDEAINVAQKCPLWKLISMFGATHSLWCMPEKRKKKKPATASFYAQQETIC